MIRTVAVFVFVSFACVATAFSQTIEKENKIDVQKKNSSLFLRFSGIAGK